MSDQDRVASQMAASSAAPGTAPVGTGTTSDDIQVQQHTAPISGSSERPDDHDETASWPPFEPIFTLLTNTTTNTTIHPRVHYLFSDDDTSVLTTPQTNPQHRALIVDLAAPTAPNGNWTVSWASSLSPDFAVVDSQLSKQQQHGGTDDGDAAGGAAVMLRVEGVEREPVDPKTDISNLPGSGSGVVGKESTEGLAEEFKRRMGVLKKVVGEEERRKEMLNKQGEDLQPEDDFVPGDANSERREDA